LRLSSTNPSQDRGDLSLRLTELRQQVESGNPEHYRQLALYLQVLRRVLPGAVDQACFHLATQIAPDRYAALPALKRQALHRRLDELVRQCSSLLTVEQLASLATSLAEERLREHLKRRRRWLIEHGGSTTETETDSRQQRGERRASASHPPSGSVVLGLDLPLGDLGGWFQLPMDPAEFQQDSDDAADPRSVDDMGGDDHDHDDGDGDVGDPGDDGEVDFADDEDAGGFPWELAFGLAGPGRQGPQHADGINGAAAQELAGPPAWPAHSGDSSSHGGEGFGIWDAPSQANPSHDSLAASDRQAGEAASDASSAGADQLRLLRASFAAMVAAVAASEGATQGGATEGGATEAPSRQDGDDESPGMELPPLPWRSGALPKDPTLLQLWLEGFEQALSRRLRNLSHAINVEFLRQELSATLLPPSLLDAVLAGRLETQSAPANLLRLPLPLPAAASPHGLVGHALLLRCGDLEGEHPQLRTCRQRLQRLRQELRKMALLQTRLQQRLRTQEAERLWMQTVRRTRTDNR
jgi:hypothetical protein